MDALGNDFMVIDGINQSVHLTPELIFKWADRKTGIGENYPIRGFDQLLLIESSSSPGCDFTYRIFNADGSEVAQCGNGARCIARFVFEKKLSDKVDLIFETQNGLVQTRRFEDNQIIVNMGAPRFALADIPAIFPEEAEVYSLEVAGHPSKLHLVSMGNPHAVLFVDDITTAPVERIGSALQANSHFPERVNVGFAQVIDRRHMKLRVFERGAGETQACGSGACAAMVAAQQKGLVDEKVTIELPGGALTVQWQGEKTGVFLGGPAELIYEGELSI
jgi:diaminopimelate epimerase